jgi:hypothetical protein
MMNLLLASSGPDDGIFAELLKAGRQAWADLAPERALALFRQAALAEPGRPEPWMEMGSLHEVLGDKDLAAYCYFLASERTA